MLAQGLAKEYSEKGIHVMHAIANEGIKDENGEAQKTVKTMSAEAVGKTYLWLSQQEPCLWTHELDLRPAQENFYRHIGDTMHDKRVDANTAS